MSSPSSPTTIFLQCYCHPHAPHGQCFDGSIAPDILFAFDESPLLRGMNDAYASHFTDARRMGLRVFKGAQGTLVYAEKAPVPPGLLLEGWTPVVLSAADLGAMTADEAAAVWDVLQALDSEVTRVACARGGTL